MEKNGATVLEYQLPVASHADKVDFKAYHEGVAKDSKRHGNENPGDDDKNLIKANVSREGAATDVLAKEGFNQDGTLKTTVKYLKLPLCPRSGQQLTINNADWQGDDYKTPPTDAFACKGEVCWTVQGEHPKLFKGKKLVACPRFYKYWEIPVAYVTQINDGQNTMFSPECVTRNDDGDDFEKAMAAALGTSS